MALPGRAIRWSPDQWVSNTAQASLTGSFKGGV